MCSHDSKMNAWVLHAVGDLRYERVPIPRRKPGEVLLKIGACGICGSDIPRIYTKGTYHFPTIPGHEFAGTVVEADDRDLLGMKAAVFPLLPCGECEYCRSENYAQCVDYNYFGSRCDGGFAEYIAVPEWNLVPAGGSVAMAEAAMCEPAAVARHAVMMGGIGDGDTVAIFGAGPIGLMLGQWSRALGADRVILMDIDPRKAAFAGEMGFDGVNSLETDPVDYIRRVTHGKGADVCIEGAGVSPALEQCMSAAAAFGRVVLMGNPMGEMKLSQKGYWEILRKQLTLRGTWNSAYGSGVNDWRAAMDAMGDGTLRVAPLISHLVHLEDGGRAFAMMRDKEEFFSKVMLVMD